MTAIDDAVAIAASDQRFENLFGWQTDFCRDGFGGEIVGIDLVFAQLIGNAELIE